MTGVGLVSAGRARDHRAGSASGREGSVHPATGWRMGAAMRRPLPPPCRMGAGTNPVHAGEEARRPPGRNRPPASEAAE